MTDTTKAQILDLARKAINTELLALKRMKETLGDNFADAVEMILSGQGKCIVTGMGKSGLVGRKIAATLASTGTPSFFLHPGEAFHGDLGMISKEDVVLALSYSGETDEILKIVPFIHSNGNKLISMTGNPESALAKNSDVHLDVSVEEEACILHLAPTTSTTAQIAMGDALAVSLLQMRGFTSVDFARLHPGGSLGRRLLMTVGNVMRSHDLPVVAPDCSATDMIHAISKGGLGLIIICDGERIEGIVTDGDVRRAMERRRAEFFNIKAADIATPNPKTISADRKLIDDDPQQGHLAARDRRSRQTAGGDPDLRHKTVAGVHRTADLQTAACGGRTAPRGAPRIPRPPVCRRDVSLFGAAESPDGRRHSLPRRGPCGGRGPDGGGPVPHPRRRRLRDHRILARQTPARIRSFPLI